MHSTDISRIPTVAVPSRAIRLVKQVLVCLVLAAAFPSVAWAASPQEQFIQDRQKELTAALGAKDKAEVDRIFDRMIDYRAIARDSLGDHWDKLKDSQKERFVCILRSLVSDAYRRDLDRTLEYEVTYHGSTKTDRGHRVKTVAKSKSDSHKAPVSIDYVVYETGGQLKVRDIYTEDSSLVNNYRAQFRRIIKKDGFDGLVKKMEKKLGDRARACRPSE